MVLGWMTSVREELRRPWIWLFPRRCVSQLGWSTICHTLPHGITLGGEQPGGRATCDLPQIVPFIRNILPRSWEQYSCLANILSQNILQSKHSTGQLGPPVSIRKGSSEYRLYSRLLLGIAAYSHWPDKPILCILFYSHWLQYSFLSSLSYSNHVYIMCSSHTLCSLQMLVIIIYW